MPPRSFTRSTGCGRLSRIRGNVIAAALGIIVFASAVRAHTRNEDWNDPLRFWESAIQAAPGSFKPRIGILGSLPQNTPEGWQRVIAEADRALMLLDKLPDERNIPFAYRNVAVIFRAHGDALAQAKKPRRARWYQGALAALQRSEGIERKLDEQYRAINGRRGIKQSTYLPAAVYRELGITYLKLDRVAYALDILEFGQNLEADPDLLENLALAYGVIGDVKKGVVVAIEALEVDSKRTYLADKILQTYKLIDPSGCPVQKDASGESLNIACPSCTRTSARPRRNVLRTYLRRQPDRRRRVHPARCHQDLGCAASALN